MGEKLTDRRIGEIIVHAQMNDGRVEKWLDSETAEAMATELRARRAADLSAEEVEALRWAAASVRVRRDSAAAELFGVGYREKCERALALLDRLTKGPTP